MLSGTAWARHGMCEIALTRRHWYSGRSDVRGFPGCILLGVAASRYTMFDNVYIGLHKLYIYIYIYMCVCVCVCCVPGECARLRENVP
jgi:hypothetical protein